MHISDYESLLKQTFKIAFSDQDLLLTLEEVSRAGKPYKEGARQPFSLIFSADASGGVLRQGRYDLENETLGKKGVFLVPVGVKENVCEYQAVYN